MLNNAGIKGQNVIKDISGLVVFNSIVDISKILDIFISYTDKNMKI